MKIEYGVQMYSVRDVAKNSLYEALCNVAKLGYRYVEFAGFFNNSAETVKQWLDELGLICSSTHTSLDALTPELFDQTVAYHKTIGCDTIIVPGASWSKEESLAENLALLSDLQKKLEAHGITLGYHNHSKEFVQTPYGKIIEQELLENTQIELEIDTFWAFNAGVDPVAFLEAHKDRIHVIHLKDGFPTAPENRNYEHAHENVHGCALGEGKAPVAKVREWAIRNGVRMVVESEGLDPTGPEEVGRCMQYLRSLE